MRLVLADPTLLKDSIAVISELVTEARFKINKEGLELLAMDPANVAMVMFKLLSTNFTEYDVETDQEISVNLVNFRQILKRVSANDIVTLETEGENKLSVQIKGSSKRTFSLPLIELEDKKQRVPSLTFPVSISTHSTVLTDAIADADIVAEAVTFAAEENKFTIEAEGDLSKAKIEVAADDRTRIQTESTAKIKSKYSIEYLKKMMNGSKLTSEVDLYFSQDYPLKIEYKAKDKLLLSFILAPRVEND